MEGIIMYLDVKGSKGFWKSYKSKSGRFIILIHNFKRDIELREEISLKRARYLQSL